MKTLRACALLATIVVSGLLAAGPRASRIVSTTLVTDEILSGLVAPSRVAGFSQYAKDGAVSNVAEIARQVNVFADRNPEQIVRLRPDLVVFASYSRIDLKNLIRQLGIPSLEIKQFGTIADIEGNIRLVAGAVGEQSAERT